MLVLDDKFRLTIDSSKQNWQLEQFVDFRDKKTKEVTRSDWQIIGYFGANLSSALKRYKNESLITDDGLHTLNDVLDRLNEIDRTIDKRVKQENIKLVVKSND